MKRWFLLCGLLLTAFAAQGQSIFNCPSFASTGACSAAQAGYSGNFQIRNGGNLSGSVIDMVPANSGHNGYNINYYTQINVQAFTTTWTFVPNGQNVALILQNTTTQPGQQGNIFTTGAGCEASFYQGSTALPNWYTPNFLWALEFSTQDWLTYASGAFSYSGVEIYQTMQNPCNPGQGSDTFAYAATSKISTSPVPLTGSSCPSGQTCTNGQFSTSGDTYSATVSYDGYTANLCLYDVTAANGSCSSGTSGTGTYFQHSWSGVYIPSIVGSTTAYVGLGSGVNIPNLPDLYVNSWSYTQNTPTGSPSYTAWNANSTYSSPFGLTSSASPVYSVAPGTYSGTQSVSITTSTTPNNYICYTLSSTVPTLFPQTDNGGSIIPAWQASTAYVANLETVQSGVYYKWSGGTTGSTEPTWPGSGSVTDGSGTWTADPNGGCSAGTRYTGPISISSTSTLYAMAGPNTPAFSNSLTNPTGLGPPSTLVAGTYTIGGSSPAATPTFSPAAGTYVGTQSVTLSTSSGGAIMCYTTNGSTPATNGTTGCTTGTLFSGAISVAASETIKAVAGGTGYLDSSVGSAAYTITTTATPVITLASGTYTLPQTTTITDSTGGAAIDYCTTTYGGSCSPTTAYSTALTIASPETICANATYNSSTSSTLCNNYAQNIPFALQINGNLKISGNLVVQ
jgi:hypothetical protein